MGGGAYLDAKSNFKNCIMLNNSAVNGGGVYVNNGGLLTNCIAVNNIASRKWWWHVWIWDSTITNCICANNIAQPVEEYT